MPRVELEAHEWGRVMQIIGTAPWNVANELLMKIGEQLRKQALPASGDLMIRDKVVARRIPDDELHSPAPPPMFPQPLRSNGE